MMLELAMYESAKMWFEKYYYGKVPNVYKRKTELVKLEVEKYNLQQEYQKVKENVEESRKRVLKQQDSMTQNKVRKIMRKM